MNGEQRNNGENSRCTCGFRQVMLSGYLDGELTQADAQKVRIHLEDCAECRQLYTELRELHGLARSTVFRLPADEQWREIPAGNISRFARSLGWLLLLVWVLLVAGFAGWQLLVSPQNLFLKVLLFGGGVGLALVFLSALMDRLRHRRSDRYDRVEK
ncbi:MAG: zf-HC2 domain-containing protein [Acidobacteria bacterium]|nr:zf-HC2 domain-containing protein [Acidobacteriota bacterium]